MRAVRYGSGGWDRVLLCTLMAVVLSIVQLSPVRAQDGELDRVQALVDSGRFASARSELQRWLASREGTAERDERQRSLWLRGLLTVDPGMAELDYRRLVLEYPGGQYSDEALLRLARIARARADDPVARGYLETLLRDYPETPNRVEARSLLEEIRESPSSVAQGARRDTALTADPSPEPSQPAQAQGSAATSADPVVEVEPEVMNAPEAIADAEPVAEPDANEPDPRTIVESPAAEVPVDPRNDPEPAVSPEPVPVSEPEPTDPTAIEPATPADPEPDVAPAPVEGGPPPDAAPFTVQLGAFSVPAGAASIAERAEAAGFPVRLVRVEGSALIRVRVGAFADLDGALARMREIQAVGLDAVVARDRADETPYADPPL